MNPAPSKQAGVRKPKDDEIETAISFSTPAWLIVLIGLLFYASGIYIDRYGGDMSADVYVPGMQTAMVKDMQPVGDSGGFEQGAKLYALYCQICHQPNGQGTDQFPPLAGSDWVKAEGPNRMIRILLNAVGGPIDVSGKQFNNDGMLAWRDIIASDEDLAAIATFIRGNKAWGNSASIVTKEQIKKIRDETAGRGSMKKWTAPELMAIPDKD